ncbi:hypothetical protein [Amycolatopsis australiensis]|uniref:Polyketide cyclase / dehydrase and lipid transport n=1 Tax=Amycolatopsis australiensis TaxID=546364 RepID=A0A1K1RQ48_9PSEU|nr:hypothetical protein [Amycolatopsis australiensis]SFW74174.1 hypothetical protein SAMN04489730_3720 [Amycolatopsis australiensis]
MKALAEVSGVVARPPGEVFEALRQRVAGGGYPLRLEVDRERGFLAVQGGWWYRGEYRVTADPGGARVEHRVVNAASRGRWGVPLANRFFLGFRARTAAGFARLLEELGRPGGPGAASARTVLR